MAAEEGRPLAEAMSHHNATRSWYSLLFERVLNIVERITGLDIDQDGDIGVDAVITPRTKVRMQRNEWLATGVFSLFLLVLTPIWNSYLLMQDPAYVYFQGKMMPALIIIACIWVMVLYCVAVLNIFRKLGVKLADDNVLSRLGAIMAMMLGCIFMFIAVELDYLAVETYVETFASCSSGPLTHHLYQKSQALYAMQMEPECASQESVELCAHFEEDVLSRTLRTMETKYQCSGFCYDSKMLGKRSAFNDSAAILGPIFEDGLAQNQEEEMNYGFARPIPRTLFSTDNHKYSCDGMTAITMSHFVGNVALQSYYEGLVLLAAAVCVGFVVVLQSCAKRDSSDDGWASAEEKKKAKWNHSMFGGLSKAAHAFARLFKGAVHDSSGP